MQITDCQVFINVHDVHAVVNVNKVRFSITIQTFSIEVFTFAHMETITWHDFEKVELRVGTILQVEDFPEARKPAFKVKVDFGEFGIKWSSAQITKHYTKEELPGRQIVAVVNFPKKQIANFMSEFLVTGFADENGDIVLVNIDKPVPNGSKLI